MQDKRHFELTVSEDDDGVAYLRLPDHPGDVAGVVRHTVTLRDLIKDYSGPEIILDFDESNTVIGIEIVG